MALTRSLMTYQDVIDHLVFYIKANPTPEAQRDARRAIQSALDELANVHTWTYYVKTSRIAFNAPKTDGTVRYEHTGDTAGERVLYLSDGEAWPDWSPYGSIIIGQVQYEVAAKISESAIQLSINTNPGADLDAGTDYTLMRDTYPLPPDCISIDQLYTVESWRRLKYIHWREWLVAHRYNVTSSNTPYFYTIMGDPNFLGIMSARFYPFPDSAITADFTYRGRSRPLNVESETAGLVVTSAGSTTLEGADTEFTSDHVGTVVRVSSDASSLPTGLDGASPFKEERMVMSVTSNTRLIVDRVFNNSQSNVKYRMSDPLDLEYGAMANAFLRIAEWQIGIIRGFGTESLSVLRTTKDDALDLACEADSRTSGPRSVDQEGWWSRRLAYMPAGADEE